MKLPEMQKAIKSAKTALELIDLSLLCEDKAEESESFHRAECWCDLKEQAEAKLDRI